MQAVLQGFVGEEMTEQVRRRRVRVGTCSV